MHTHSCFFCRGCARAPKDHHPSHLLESQWCDHGFCHPGSDLCTCVQCADLCLVEEEVTASDAVEAHSCIDKSIDYPVSEHEHNSNENSNAGHFNLKVFVNYYRSSVAVDKDL